MTFAGRPLRAGDRLPELQRSCDLIQSVRFAGASQNYHRIHWDHEFARSDGLPQAIVASGMLLAWIEELLDRSFGLAAILRSIDVSYRGSILIDEVARCGGSVIEVGDDGNLKRLKVEIWIKGEEDRPRIQGSAIVDIRP